VFTWTATTPDDSRIDFHAQVADEHAGLDAAPRLFIATAEHEGGNTAFAQVGNVLGVARVKRWLRIVGDEFRASDGKGAPAVGATSMQFDCLPQP
jgi:hypothetical protein